MAEKQLKQRAKHTVVELAIESIGARGDGVGWAKGNPVYVPLSAPGDRLRVVLERPRGEGFAGRIVEVLAEGAGRTQAPCPHFGGCGGCVLQHVEDRGYAAWKAQRV